MPRVIWKGAISFGLVHVPVALYPASTENDIDFDLLDKRSMDPVGYKRVNKRTGEEIDKAFIVKGVKVDDGAYVVLGEDEIRAAYPKTTQTIEIESFVAPTQIPFTLLERPYYLEPLPKAEKVYALLREALLEAGVVGVARVVMHTKEHLAVLAPVGPALMLNTVRWAGEIRPWTELKLPAEGRKASGLKDAELKMAGKLISEMTTDWKAEQYADQFGASLRKLIEQRVAAGHTEAVEPLEEGEPSSASASNVVDLTELLARSLKSGGSRSGASAAPTRKAEARKPPTRKAVPRKRA
jgi:DNA end-binding protein Ku